MRTADSLGILAYPNALTLASLTPLPDVRETIETNVLLKYPRSVISTSQFMFVRISSFERFLVYLPTKTL